jgi:uncharacterized protein (TIGR02246 family)
MNHPQQVFPHNADSADVDNLLGRVAELERTQLAEDVDGFLALFKPDAVWVTGGGRRLAGREQISDFTRQVLPGAFENASVRYDVEVISFVTPDVAVTGVNQQYTDSGGHPTSAGLPTYVWTRHEETWLIAAGQNTGVVDDD